MRIFLDANILFAAAFSPDGAVSRLLMLLEQSGHQCCASDYVIREAHRNLLAKKPATLGRFAQLLEPIQITMGPVTRLGELPEVAKSLPEKDRVVLAAAIHQGCEALVTGDRTHFGPLYGETISGVAIHSPASLAEALIPPQN